MAETDLIGYKRTIRGEKITKNELYRTDEKNKILVDDGVQNTIVDYIRNNIEWE